MMDYFPPGTLVKADRPDFNVPKDERRKVGLVIGHLPPGHHSNGYAIPMLLVAWSGPGTNKFLTVEPDGRVSPYL
jgi:hypothetical protein